MSEREGEKEEITNHVNISITNCITYGLFIKRAEWKKNLLRGQKNRRLNKKTRNCIDSSLSKNRDMVYRTECTYTYIHTKIKTHLLFFVWLWKIHNLFFVADFSQTPAAGGKRNVLKRYFFASQVRRQKWHEKTCFPAATRWNDLEMDGSDHRTAEKHVTRLWTYKRNWKHNTTTAIPSDKAGDKAKKKHKHFARSHREIN